MNNEQQLKAGDIVQFNVGKPEGPVFSGIVVKVNRTGPVIQPHRPGYLAAGAKFYNIRKPEKKGRG